MKRLVMLAVLLVIVIAAASSGSKHQTQTTTSEAPPPPAPTTSTPVSHPGRPASANTRCDQNISVNSHATCGFADNVFRAYAHALHADTSGELSHEVEASSPVTGKTYTMSCRAHGGTESAAICTGANSATVKFPVIAAQEKKTPTPSKQESPPSGEESTPPAGESGGSEEDQVGSSSHATDAKFCSEHECIGSFETEGGTIVECADGTYSHAGGISGACSHHGGEH